MKTVPLLDLVERRTICVFRQDGRWMASWFSEAGRNAKELSWFLESPSMIHDALQMVFENEAEIAAFLAEPDPRFEPLRFLAYYGRQNASTLVMTVNELLDNADAEGLLTPMGTGNWREALGNATVDIRRSPLAHSPFTDSRIQAAWCLPGLTKNGMYGYAFLQILQHHAALDAIWRRRPQTRIPGKRTVVSWRENYSEFLIEERRRGYFLVVPDDRTVPVMGSHAIRGESKGGNSSESRWSLWTLAQPATVYQIKEPLLLQVCCGTMPRPMVDRSAPLDVLIAGR